MTGPSYDDRPTPDPTPEPSLGRTHEPVPGRTRTGGLWVAVGAATVVLLLLLVFILQNGSRVQINLFGVNPKMPLGAVLVVLIGAARVVQLRHTARKLARSR